MFCLKLFLYFLVIPASAYYFQTYAYKLAIPLILLAKQIPRQDHYGIQIFIMLSFAINTLFFYIYVAINLFVKSGNWHRRISIFFICFPAFIGVGQFTMAFYWSFLGSLIFNGYFYTVYFILRLYMPSFRDQMK